MTQVVVLVVGLLGLVIFQKTTLLAGRVSVKTGQNERVGVAWTEKASTAAGALIVLETEKTWRRWIEEPYRRRRRLPRAEVLYHLTADTAVVSLNRIANLWPVFLLLSAAGLLAAWVLLTKRMATPRHAALPAFAGAYFFLANGALAITIPASSPAWLRNCGLSLAGVLAGGGLFILVDWYLSRGSKDKRIFKYGPPLLLPTNVLGRTARPEDGVLVGKVAKDIFPQYTRWTGTQNGDIVIPFDRLSSGVTILGEKGSGKSRLLFAFHDAIRKRYPRVPILIHDPKGEWYRTFFNPKTDLVFAPHFEGSASWSIWSDFKRIPQLRHELIATAVYAHADQGDTFWMDSAIQMLLSVAKEPTIAEAANQLNLLRAKNKDDKFWTSVLGTALLGFIDIAKVELRSTSDNERRPMSIDEFLRWPGRIFLLNDPRSATEQKGAFSLFLSAFMLQALGQPDVAAGQLQAVAIVDEALTFTLPREVDRRIYALCRSKGLSVISGAQRLPERHAIERGEWQTAEFLFGMKVIAQETQNSLSRRVGQILYDEPRKSHSESDGRVSKSESEQREKVDAVPAEHFGRLASREFILFHDRGLVSGRTAESSHPQRDLPPPGYLGRDDVLDFIRTLN